MKIRTSVNLYFVVILVIAVCSALAFSVIQAKSYTESTFYRSVPLMLEASSSDLQTNLAVGLALSQDLAEDTRLLDWFNNYEKDNETGSKVVEDLITLSKDERFAASFAASKLTGNYYVVDSNQQLKKTTMNETDDAWFFTMMKSPQTLFYSVDYNKTLNDTNFWVDVKMFNAAGEAIGFAGMAVNLKKTIAKMNKSLQKSSSLRCRIMLLSQFRQKILFRLWYQF